MQESKMSDQKEIDIYRDTPLRLVGYANEVGEAFRALIHRSLVKLSYGIAFTYVLADTFDKAKRVEDNTKKITEGADVLIWQTLASVAIPGFTINRICYFSAILLSRGKFLPPMTQKWVTTGIGLGSIPFIVKPIDHSVDWLMDQTWRKIFPTQQRSSYTVK